ncbi:YdcF family protein, partial [Mesorhizobium sp. M7A.F.Ca.US.003.02.1.1]
MAMDARDSTGTAGQMPVVVARSHDRRAVSRLRATLRLSALSVLILATL